MTKAEEIEKLQEELREAYHAYEVAEQEFIDYGGMWAQSLSDQCYREYNRIRVKLLRLMEMPEGQSD